MGSVEQRDFYLSRIEGRIRILERAIDDKNVNFDIKNLTEAVNKDLKAAEEITEKLLENCVERDSLEEIGKQMVDIQLHFEVSLETFKRYGMTTQF